MDLFIPFLIDRPGGVQRADGDGYDDVVAADHFPRRSRSCCSSWWMARALINGTPRAVPAPSTWCRRPDGAAGALERDMTAGGTDLFREDVVAHGDDRRRAGGSEPAGPVSWWRCSRPYPDQREQTLSFLPRLMVIPSP
ncbi:hypothetical protein P4114_28965 [Pseudomonas aeruginosa]|nr:hypothetical protein [Pseudomonas aeruginosa]